MIIVFIFMYIFGFNLIGPIDSSIAVGLILSVYLFFDKKFAKIFNRQICNKRFLCFIFFCLILILWSILVVFINNTYDFSYLKTFIHFIICMIIGVELLGYIDSKGKMSQIVNYIIICFCIQSLFQVICYAFPSFSNMFNYFRSQQMIEIGATYNGFRGIALTKSGFFSLSAAYSVIFVLYFSKYNTLTKKAFNNFLILILLIIGTFFAGRTGFVGLVYAIIMKIFFCFWNKKIKFNIVKFSKLGLILFLSILLLINLSRVEKVQKLYTYVFEAFYNLSAGNGFSTSSSDILIDMYDVDLSPLTFICGDGKYYEKDGNIIRYYKRTDVGYLRKILYFGIIGLLISFLIQLLLFGNKLKNYEKVTLFGMLMILEIKGEIIGLNIMVSSIVILFSKFSTIKKEDEIECNI